MMTKPTDLPVWNTLEERTLQPDATRQATGWVWSSTKFEKPKGEHFNWWMNNVYKWTAHLDEVVGDGSAKLWQNKAITITPPTDADYTLTATENAYGRLVLDLSNWTQARNIIVDDTERSFLVDNSSGTYTATVKTSAGTGIPVLAGTKVWLLCDGTNVIESVDSGVEIASTAEAQAGIDNTKVITPLRLHETMLGGVSQTWQNVTASRAAGVTYTNTTGKPIYIKIRSASQNANSLLLLVDTIGVDILANNAPTAVQASIDAIVPNGSTYRADNSGNVIIFWAELR